MVAAEHELDGDVLPLGELRYRRFVHGAARQHHGLAGEVAEIQDAAAAAHEELGAGHEHGWRKRHRFATLEIVRRRTAFEVDVAGGHEVEAIFWRHRPPYHADVLAEFRRDLLDDDFAEVERVT